MTAPDQPPSTEEPLYVGKEVAYFGAVVGAWVNTRMERDKSLLTLSGAGIALLGTVATAVGVHGVWQIVAFTAAFVGFVLSAAGAVGAFHWNADYLAREARRAPREPKADPPALLRISDWVMFVGFVVGLVGAAALSTLLALAPRKGEVSGASASRSSGTPPAASCPCCCVSDAPPRSDARDSTMRTDSPALPRPDSASGARPQAPRHRHPTRPVRSAPPRSPADTLNHGAGASGPLLPQRNVCPPASPPPPDTGHPPAGP